jgi:AcrR family transcriptional regulator
VAGSLDVGARAQRQEGPVPPGRQARDQEGLPPRRRSAREQRAHRRRLPVGERRDELINAALELLSTRSADAVSMDDVAARAGASRALVYHYFGNKHELYIAALRRAAEQLTGLLDPPVEGGPLQRLTVALSRYFDYVEDHAAGYITLMRGQPGAAGPASVPGEVGEIVDGVRQVLLDRILEALGATAAGPVLRITLRSWLSGAETAGLDWLERRDMPRATLEAMLIAQMVALLRVAGRYDPAVASLAGSAERSAGLT